jgi:Tfp pilus assembly protein PilV
MLSPASLPPAHARGASPHHAIGFTLVEVLLSLGVIAIAIISVLGLIAPTLSEVQQTQELNEGVACIAKMNSLIDTAPFWDSAATASGETVWQWIADSHSTSPTVFLFFNEIPQGASSTANSIPVQRVVRFNVSAVDTINVPNPLLAINIKDPAYTQFPLYEGMTDFLAAVNESRISGPVIAMTLSLSPLAQHFPTNVGVPAGSPYSGINEQSFYVPPAVGVLNGLFSDTAFGTFLTDPDGFNSKTPFPEAYLPIYIQAFSVSVASVQSTSSAPDVETQIINNFSTGNRLFTYTTAKLR